MNSGTNMLPLTWDQGPRAAAEEEAGGWQEPSKSHLRIKKYTRARKRGSREMISEGSVRQVLMGQPHLITPPFFQRILYSPVCSYFIFSSNFCHSLIYFFQSTAALIILRIALI